MLDFHDYIYHLFEWYGGTEENGKVTVYNPKTKKSYYLYLVKK